MDAARPHDANRRIATAIGWLDKEDVARPSNYHHFERERMFSGCGAIPNEVPEKSVYAAGTAAVGWRRSKRQCLKKAMKNGKNRPKAAVANRPSRLEPPIIPPGSLATGESGSVQTNHRR